MGNTGQSQWNVRDAKSKFSELMARAADEPQTIINRGRKQAVVINIEEFEKMINDLQELKRLFKKHKALKFQRDIQAAYEKAGIETIDFEPTPNRPLPEFD